MKNVNAFMHKWIQWSRNFNTDDDLTKWKENTNTTIAR